MFSFKSLLKRQYGLILRGKGNAVELRTVEGRDAARLDDDPFATVMWAVRHRLVESTRISTRRFPLTPLCTNNLTGIIDLQGSWEDDLFAKRVEALEAEQDPLIRDLLEARAAWVADPSLINPMALSTTITRAFGTHRVRRVFPDLPDPVLADISVDDFFAGKRGSVTLPDIGEAKEGLRATLSAVATQRGLAVTWKGDQLEVVGTFDLFKCINGPTVDIPDFPAEWVQQTRRHSETVGVSRSRGALSRRRGPHSFGTRCSGWCRRRGNIRRGAARSCPCRSMSGILSPKITTRSLRRRASDSEEAKTVRPPGWLSRRAEGEVFKGVSDGLFPDG